MVRSFVMEKIQWIKKHQAKFHGAKPVVRLRYVSGESHAVWGRPATLMVIPHAGSPRVHLADGCLDLRIKTSSTQAQRRAALDAYYREELRQAIPPLLRQWEAIIGVRVAEFGIKKMRTRWGTCNIRTRKIWVNLELAKRSPRCLTFIIVHELTHLLEKRHNARFYAFMDRFLPDWREIKTELNGSKIVGVD